MSLLIKIAGITILSFTLMNYPSFANDDTEKLKLEIERLKLENANLKLKNQPASSVMENDEKFKKCLSKSDIDLCFELVQKDDKEQKDSSYSKNVKKIKMLAQSGCKNGRELECSLLGLILYNYEKDISAIPVMEKYCVLHNENVSARCFDLFEYYLGQGKVSHKPDVKRASELTRRCIETKDYDSCGFFFNKLIQYPTDDPNITFSKISELAKSSLKSKTVQSSQEMTDYFQFIESCRVSLVVEWKNRNASSSQHISTWIRYKNLSKNPLKFSGELKAGITQDPLKVFVSQYIGKTLGYGRYLQPNELIREEATFSVDADKAEKWLSDFKPLDFLPTEISSTNSGKSFGSDNPILVKRMCHFDITFE